LPSCCARIFSGPGIRTVKEIARSYLTITKDLTRVMVRLKALYRSRAIPVPHPERRVPARAAQP
jgi:predicted RNA polymerase sigma factor